MALTPKNASDSLITKLSESEASTLTKAVLAEHLERALKIINPENKPTLRRMAYDRVPVGHDIGYRCYDGSKHDPESAFTSGEYGDGLSQNEAYRVWLQVVDEPKPRPTRVIHTSRYEPDDYASRPDPEPDDGNDFDTDLEPHDER